MFPPTAVIINEGDFKDVAWEANLGGKRWQMGTKKSRKVPVCDCSAIVVACLVKKWGEDVEKNCARPFWTIMLVMLEASCEALDAGCDRKVLDADILMLEQ
eukprot:scaffold648813_cov37-Prasinocladus_malaysianus.AAC.1